MLVFVWICADVINPQKVDNWQTGCSWSRANQESCQRGFSSGPAGSWTEVSPMGTLQPGRHTGGQSWVSALAPAVEPAFWWSSGWHQQQAGLSSGKEGDHTHTHSATLLLRSKRRLAGRAALEKLPLSGDGFHVNRGLNRRCVTALVARWAPSDPLLLGF